MTLLKVSSSSKWRSYGKGNSYGNSEKSNEWSVFLNVSKLVVFV